MSAMAPCKMKAVFVYMRVVYKRYVTCSPTANQPLHTPRPCVCDCTLPPPIALELI